MKGRVSDHEGYDNTAAFAGCVILSGGDTTDYMHKAAVNHTPMIY